MTNTIIFDFDGTIADTLPVIIYSFQRVFKNYENRELSRQDILTMFGPTEEGIIKENFINKKNVESAINEFYRLYEAHHIDLVQNYEEIQKLLTGLKAKNYKLAIVTGKGRKCFDLSMKMLGLNSFFDLVITGDDVKKAKPDPEGILKVLKELNVNNSQAMFIGDSNADIEAGRSAKVFTIGVQWLSESQTKDFLVEPDKKFLRVNDFEHYLEEYIMVV